MGWHGNGIGFGNNQSEWLGHGDRCSCCDEFNGDDHDDENWVCWWLGASHGDVTSWRIDSNIWGHDINGYWFHGADREL